MSFKLSARSIKMLTGVNQQLVEVVYHAIKISKIDFAVIEGVRTQARQKELVAKGASQTMQSKHMDGRAVDLMAYIGTRPSWELNLYDDIADAVKIAAIEVGVPIRWGGAWSVMDITKWSGTMQAAQDSYIALRRSQGRRVFIDGPHFELAD
jgi:peptidoglycan L-alanyl-D-glutamate endopeptidase CwlK